VAYVSDEAGTVDITVGLIGHPGPGVVASLRTTHGRLAPETRGPLRHGVLRTGRFASFSHWPLGRDRVKGRVLRVEIVGGDVAQDDELALLLSDVDAVVIMGHDPESLRYHEARAARALAARRCLPPVPRVYGLEPGAHADAEHADAEQVRRGAASDLELDEADIEEELTLALRTATEVALRAITRPRRKRARPRA